MPKYKTEIQRILDEDEVNKIWERASNEKERVLISLLWITAGRPAELIQIKKSDIQYNDKMVKIQLQTKKLRGQKFYVRDRTIEFERTYGMDQNIYLEHIINYISLLDPDTRLIKHTTRWCQKVVSKLSKQALGEELNPYHFRHSVLTWLARNGANIPELMHFKGARSESGVRPYIHAQPFLVKQIHLKKRKKFEERMENEGFQ